MNYLDNCQRRNEQGMQTVNNEMAFLHMYIEVGITKQTSCCTSGHIGIWVSEWLLFNVKMSNFCSAISWREQVIVHDMMMMSARPAWLVDFYCNTNFILNGLSKLRLETTIYHTREVHVNHIPPARFHGIW